MPAAFYETPAFCDIDGKQKGLPARGGHHVAKRLGIRLKEADVIV